MPKVSVIIPVYNVRPYLSECLDSVKEQSFGDMEIICIDDKSDDGSLNILKEYARRDSRFIVYENERRRGLAYTRNVGLDKASGDYLLFVDSDDYVKRELLEVVLQRADGNDLVCFDYWAQVENGPPGASLAHRYDMNRGVYKGSEFFIQAVEKKSVIYSAWSRLYRRRFLTENDIRFYDGILFEDIAFCFQCLLTAEHIYSITEPLYRYRVRENSIMTEPVSYRKLEGYFVNICELTRYYFRNDFDRRTAKAAERYIQNVCRVFIKTYRECGEHIPPEGSIIGGNSRYLKPYRLFADLCNRMDESAEIHLPVGRLRESKNIVVYGAGGIARAVIEILDQRDIPIRGIAVTSASENRVSLMGNSVRELSRYMEIKNECLVIIAAGRGYHEEMHGELKKYGFSNYVEAV